ncbi:MAG: TolC family protein [Pyrinomonadaceae bacterium]|nr:TolC family protein [Pyrinomonadaceae bacterium]
MKYQAILMLIVLFAISAVAQDPAKTPPVVNDVQDAKPDTVKSVPDIASGFESKSTALPNIGRVGVDMRMQVPISAKEVIVRALENNGDIEVSRKDVKIAEFDLTAADLPFTPVISGQTYFERETAPNVSIFNTNPSTTNKSLVGELSYSGIDKRFGTSFSVTFKNRRLSTDNPVSILSPQYDSSLEFRVSQPLWRGRKSDDNRRRIEIARQNLRLTDKQFRQKAIEITASVQKAYWDLTFALRNLKVQRDGVGDAKQQLEHNKRLVKEGVLAPVDILAAETQVANLELQVYAALEQVNRAENYLKGLISSNKDDELWMKSLVPTDQVDLTVPNTTLPEALALALDNRIEFDILEVSKQINEYDQQFYKDALDPIIDVFASYKSNGISGTANSSVGTFFSNSSTTTKVNEVITRVNALDPNMPPIDILPIPPPQTVPTSITGNYLSSVTDIFANRYPTFSAGVTFTIAPNGKAQRALLGKAYVEGEKIRVQRQQLEQLVQIDVRNALQTLRTSEARLRAAAISRENSEKQYESEKRKLDAGLTDIYKVLERQTALMRARSAELQARTELNKSIAELQRATGNSLKANDVETKLVK